MFYCLVCYLLTGLILQTAINEGDTVSIYLLITWQSSTLACARIGAVHSVVFAGVSSESLRDRILDCTPTKAAAVRKLSPSRRSWMPPSQSPQEGISSCMRKLQKSPHTAHRRSWQQRIPFSFSMYVTIPHTLSPHSLPSSKTSRSTGKPKCRTHHWCIPTWDRVDSEMSDVHPDDKIACMANVGQITGHTYIVYGPFCNGVTTTVFELTLPHPIIGRQWRSIRSLRFTQPLPQFTYSACLAVLGASAMVPALSSPGYVDELHVD